ncbi:hypothetical protein NFI96_017989, partial [Prochilodus magdalenae]
ALCCLQSPSQKHLCSAMKFILLLGYFYSNAVLFTFLSADTESEETLRNLAVKRGGSLSVPCFYDHKYKTNRKYWCKGYYWSSCQIVAYTNTRGRTSVTDHPTQNMFTLELNSLQDSDSGSYWCAVEIGGHSVPDDRDYLYVMVSADPAVSVINSRVSGQEGGSVSVQCFYSAGYKNKQRQWCRFKDWSCYTVGRTVTSQNSAVQISDDGKGSVSVKMRGLQKSDAGWYWFSAEDVAVTVHLTVTERPSGKITCIRNTAHTCSYHQATMLYHYHHFVSSLLIFSTDVTTTLSSQDSQKSVNTPGTV